ncbi:outer membrane beta-barrel protein [Aestuariivivens insulae]|uniref:outer membrane beta-barrel protein n=1 Tax=Aestuariivivens insulae TaxID=1621988 RepID=UPI001F5A479D|nr:outer membrane beta-barrel family protein [Aestuariivivens insulae]
MQFKLFVVIFLLSISIGFSQQFQVTGTVTNSSNQPIAFANIVLKSSTNNDGFLVGTTTDEQGIFNFKNLTSNNYSIEISYLGFKTKHIALDLKKDTHLETIVLTEDTQELEGVTVIAKKPTVKRLVDRLVFNVENSTLSNNNVLDVLKHTPGVIVNDGKITVKQGTPTVYINDRKVHLSMNEVQQLLEGTTATNLKSIEVITNPPAKYEAEGGAVLNIVMAKNLIAGYNGSVFGNYKQGSEYPKYSFGTSHFFKTKKLSTYINYNISPKKEYREVDEFVNFIDNTNQVFSSWSNEESKIQKSSNHNINVNMDYEFDDKNSLSLSSNILIAPRKNSKTNVLSSTEVFNSNKQLDSIFNTSNNSVLETFNLAFSLDYVHKFEKEGEKLSVNAHHTNFDTSNFQDVNTNYLFPDNTLRNNKFQTFSSQLVQLNTAQIDYVLPLDKSAEFETGAKISSIDSDNIITQYIFDNGQKTEDPLNSNTFLYNEANYAAYASYSKDWDKWSLKAGVRAEYTDIKGNSLSDNQINKNDYLKFFPSFHLLKKADKNNEWYFKYNRRIFRPRYSQLNPFKFFYNDNVYTEGDPNLKPQIDDVFTIGWGFKSKYTFEAYYRNENNPALEIVFQDNENNKLVYKNTNIDNSVSYGLDFSTYTKVVDRWNLYVLSSLFYYDNKFYLFDSANTLFGNDQWSFYTQMINYFTLLKDKSLEMDLSMLYISSIADGASIYSDRLGISVDFKKTLWDNRATVNFGIKDVFNSLNFYQRTKYSNQDILLKSRSENRLFVFGFNYKFGNFRLKESKKSIDIEERDRL